MLCCVVCVERINADLTTIELIMEGIEGCLLKDILIVRVVAVENQHLLQRERERERGRDRDREELSQTLPFMTIQPNCLGNYALDAE